MSRLLFSKGPRDGLKGIANGPETGPPTAPETIRHRWRFAVVLAASLLLAVAQPLTSGLCR